ncbi:MAG TPA: PEP/pyruvate-binding domain-containing protein [Patescibacteria group bacterium]
MFTLNFKKINNKMVLQAGGKGASLGELTKAGIPVPRGFVVTAETFERFLAETDINLEIDAQLNKVHFEDINSVEKASKAIRDLIGDQIMPQDIGQEILKEFSKLKSKYVAVRSSATAEDSQIASWAGELETYLNTAKETLLDNVKNCWSSLFTPRAIFYGCAKGVYQNGQGRCGVSVAVVVQEMVQSEVAGICFSVHPVTEDKNQMIIEAGWGLGEAVVSGQITPDSYVLDKRDFSLLDINISRQEKMIVRSSKRGDLNKWTPVPGSKQNQQKLTGKQTVELVKLCAKIEKHYKFPVDIEWALKKGKFYITQSRPITTL